jgi:diacylglycerol kinase (ATP)
VVGVGGDGTLHEIVNGLLDGRERLPPDLAIGLVPAGRGSDYARGLGLSRDPQTLVARFAAWLAGDATAARAVDIGEVIYQPSAIVAGRPQPVDALPPSPIFSGAAETAAASMATRRFINGAGLGFSPFVAQRTGRFPARLGPYLYTAAGILTIVDWRDRGVRLRWAEGGEDGRQVESIELALGGYEGGGMHVAPGADPSDGLFDALVIDAASRLELLTFAWRIRSGDHLRSPRVSLRRTTGLDVEVVDGRGPLYLQADGELLGRDPCRFRILPAALKFVC